MSLTKKWPVLGQVKALVTGRVSPWELGTREPEMRSERTEGWRARVHDAQKVVSVCPYCAVGCSTNVYVRDGRVIDVEGNPDSPINEGTLCPKGSAIFGLTVNPHRLTTVKYRRPGGTAWEEVSLEWAMERIAQRIRETRDATMQLDGEGKDGQPTRIRQCTGIASLGGACLDNEENYLIKKLFTAGLGIVWLENQARV